MSQVQMTSEQVAICSFIANDPRSLIIQALAGSGKTSTLKIAASRVRVNALAVAFNKKIADDLAKAMPPHFTVATMNSLGHRAWGKVTRKRLNLNTGKIFGIVRDLRRQNEFPNFVDKAANAEFDQIVTDLARDARKNGLVPSTHSDDFPGLIADSHESWESIAESTDQLSSNFEHFEAARKVLIRSIEMSFEGTIDFDDQIYMSTLFGGQFQKYPLVFVDEAQDLNPLNHLMIEKSVGNRLVAVGDRNQCIYAFRGSLSNSMDKLAERFNCEELQLTTCFRCSSKVIENAKQFTPEIRALTSAKPGTVAKLKKLPNWNEIPPNSAFISRMHKPLMHLAFQALEAGCPITYIGRDIGAGLKRFLATVAAKGNPSRKVLIEKATDIASRETNVKRAAKMGEYISLLDSIPGDEYEIILANICHLLESKDGTITFVSGHGSKGLEWDNVYHIEPELIPHKYAITEEDLQQERNIHYVIETRPKVNLYKVPAIS